MSSRDYLGEFEHIVILALLRLAGRAYGVTVRQEIEVRTGREVSIGAIYAHAWPPGNEGLCQIGEFWRTYAQNAGDDRNVFSMSPPRECRQQ